MHTQGEATCLARSNLRCWDHRRDTVLGAAAATALNPPGPVGKPAATPSRWPPASSAATPGSSRPTTRATPTSTCSLTHPIPWHAAPPRTPSSSRASPGASSRACSGAPSPAPLPRARYRVYVRRPLPTPAVQLAASETGGMHMGNTPSRGAPARVLFVFLSPTRTPPRGAHTIRYTCYDFLATDFATTVGSRRGWTRLYCKVVGCAWPASLGRCTGTDGGG